MTDPKITKEDIDIIVDATMPQADINLDHLNGTVLNAWAVGTLQELPEEVRVQVPEGVEPIGFQLLMITEDPHLAQAVCQVLVNQSDAVPGVVPLRTRLTEVVAQGSVTPEVPASYGVHPVMVTESKNSSTSDRRIN